METNKKISRRQFLTTGAAISTTITASATGLVTDGLVDTSKQADLPISENRNVGITNYESKTGYSVWTDMVHAGEDPKFSAYPITQATTSPQYARDGCPTVNSIEEKLSIIEGSETSIATACGIAAISQTLLTHLKTGSRMVYHRCIYDGAIGLIDTILTKNGIDCCPIDMTDLSQLEDALKKKTDIVYFEIHSNPTIDVVNVAEAIRMAHYSGAMVIIDNTFLTPYLIRPLSMGADIVIHSATKYMMGHGNGLAGIICGSKKLLNPIKSTRKYVGGVMAPVNAYLLHQGLKTLPMRLERHCSNAMKVAEFLSKHPKIKRVHYPGLPSDPGHATALKQMNGFGAMMGFELDSDKQLNDFKVIHKKTSLGDVNSLIVTGFIEKERRNIPKNYYRFSVGIEDPNDLITDLKQALEKV